MLLVCRALCEIGYQSEMTMRKGEKIVLTSPWNNIELLWDDSGTITLFNDEKILLRIIPIASALTASENVNFIAEQIQSLYAPFLKASQSESSTQIDRTLVIYPGSEAERSNLSPELQRQVCSPGIDLSIPLPFGMIPVRSYELGSLERVGRALRWAIFVDFLLDYPVSVPAPTKYSNTILKSTASTWLKATQSKDSILVMRQAVGKEKMQLEELVHDWRGELVRQGQKSHQQEIDRLNGFLDKVDSAEKKLRQLRICPVCKNEARIENFDLLDNECFKCECMVRDCGAVWGLQFCQSGNHRYPYLAIKSPLSNLEKKADWVDREYGMDVLASPCPIENGNLTFICPICGDCSNQDEQNMLCKDCQAFRKPINMEKSQ